MHPPSRQGQFSVPFSQSLLKSPRHPSHNPEPNANNTTALRIGWSVTRDRLRPVRAPILLLASVLCISCDSEPEGPTPEQKAAAEKKKQEEEEAAKRKAERKAEEEAAAALEKKLDELTVLPAEYPKKLDKACDAMLASYDGFMRKVLQGDQLTKWETGGNEMQLAVFRKECLKRNPETAACQSNALTNAGPDLEQQLPDIMKKCAEKHGGGTDGSRPPGQ